MEQQSSPDPSRIMQIGMGFWAAKVVLAAVRFKLFSVLAKGKLSGKQIKDKLELGTTDRHVYDWLDSLVSLGFLQREGVWDKAIYSNSADADMFLDDQKPSYLGGILLMANSRLYNVWSKLDDALKTGKAQNEEGKGGNMEIFEEMYKDPDKLQLFMDGMSGIQTGNFNALINKFDFNNYDTMADIGGADGWLSILVCGKHPKIKCINFDLPPVEPLATKKIAKYNLSDRISHHSGDFVKNELPHAQVITMGNILHGFNEELKHFIIKKIYNSLPAGGAFIAIENIIDNERKQNTFGLLMSLNMMLENGEAFDYSFDEFEKWTKEAGFKKTELIPLAGPCSAAVAYK